MKIQFNFGLDLWAIATLSALLAIIIVLAVVGIMKALEWKKRRDSHYEVRIEDHSGGAVVLRNDFAMKMKLQGTETYAIYLRGLKKFVPLPTESLIEKFEQFRMLSRLEGKWKTVPNGGAALTKEGFNNGLLVEEEQKKTKEKIAELQEIIKNESEVMMGFHKGKLVLHMITNDGHNFFYKKKLSKEDLTKLNDQIIPESRKFFTGNFLKWLESIRTKSNYERLQQLAPLGAIVIIAIVGAIVWINTTKTLEKVAAIAKPTIEIHVDDQLIEDYLNKQNLTMMVQPLPQDGAPPG